MTVTLSIESMHIKVAQFLKNVPTFKKKIQLELGRREEKKKSRKKLLINTFNTVLETSR